MAHGDRGSPWSFSQDTNKTLCIAGHWPCTLLYTQNHPRNTPAECPEALRNPIHSHPRMGRTRPLLTGLHYTTRSQAPNQLGGCSPMSFMQLTACSQAVRRDRFTCTAGALSLTTAPAAAVGEYPPDFAGPAAVVLAVCWPLIRAPAAAFCSCCKVLVRVLSRLLCCWYSCCRRCTSWATSPAVSGMT